MHLLLFEQPKCDLILTVSQFGVEAMVHRKDGTAQPMMKIVFLQIRLLLTPNMNTSKSQTTVTPQRT